MESGSSGSQGDRDHEVISRSCASEQPAADNSEGVCRLANGDEHEEEDEINPADRRYLSAAPQLSKGVMMASVSDSHLDYSSAAASKGLPDAVSNESGVDSEEPNHELPSSIIDKAKELTIERLQAQLLALQTELIEKDAKCEKLSQMQSSVDTEIHELTEHLFQEAYRMVQDAQLKRVHAEKLLTESRMKIDVLSAEVEALKSLVTSQSPSRSSRQNQPRGASPNNSPTVRKTSLTPRAWLANATSSANSPGKKLPFMLQRRNTSETIEDLPLTAAELRLREEEERMQKQVDFKEVDPIFHKEFTQWRERPEIDPESPFLRRIINEEIKPCLHFDNNELANLVLEAIKANSLEIELISEEKPIVKTCALSRVPRFCPFRMRVDTDSDWHYVSQLCRNRIAAVCDFFTYLRYLRQGLVKCGLHDAYWDVIGLRKNIALARLGLGFIPKQGARGDDDGH